ncbi:TrlF family AAA-like ATPase [Solidesulfovibrio sp.]
MANDDIGSVWRKSDLHLHTPVSFDYSNKAITPKQIVNTLVENGISLVAITDHFFICPEFISNLRKEAGDKICFLPGVEFRSDLGDNAVHIIGIFSEKSDLNQLSINVQALTKIYQKDLSNRKTMESKYCNHMEVIEFIKEHSGVVSIHAGCGRHGSLETISNYSSCTRTLKTDYLNDNVDILDVTKDQHVDDYTNIVFPSIGKILPIIIGTDNHNINSYELKVPCWVKCCAYFDGLKQIIHEPKDRVFLGDIPHSLENIANNPQNYIKKIQINKKDDSKLGDKWFDKKELPINSGLVSIIGNKGSGKSALVDIVALLANTHQNMHSFSFLNQKQFNHPKYGKAKHFNATMEWCSGEKTGPIQFDANIDHLKNERATYLPQKFLEELCNESDGVSVFQNELHKVIFSHIPESETLDKDSMEQLISYVTEEITERTTETIGYLKSVNSEIVEIEEKMSEEYKIKIRNQYNEIVNVFKETVKRKPKTVTPPNSDDHDNPANKTLKEELCALSNESSELKDIIEAKNKDLKQANREMVCAEKILLSIQNFIIKTDKFKEDISTELAEIGIKIEDVIRSTVNTDKIRHYLEQKRTTIDSIKKELDIFVENSLKYRLKKKNERIVELTNLLTKDEKKYQDYLSERIHWRENLLKLKGSAEEPGTIIYLRGKLNSLLTLPDILEAKKIRRKDICKDIYKNLDELKQKYEHYYHTVKVFIANSKSVFGEAFDLDFSVTMEESNFESKFFEMIDQSRVGSFCGKEQARNRLKNFLQSSDFETFEGMYSFIDGIIDMLSKDYRNNFVPIKNVPSQLSKNSTMEDVYNLLFSIGYIQPKYQLVLGGKNLEQLSPGERGNLLLVFYLLIDKSTYPLLLDQPEDNLDNQTVYKILVPCIREARKKRQILMVTHNPNLAVVCDSDQIIHTDILKDNQNEVVYTLGAIENEKINAKLLDVLEGTRPAFCLRESKYFV